MKHSLKIGREDCNVSCRLYRQTALKIFLLCGALALLCLYLWTLLSMEEKNHIVIELLGDTRVIEGQMLEIVEDMKAEFQELFIQASEANTEFGMLREYPANSSAQFPSVAQALVLDGEGKAHSFLKQSSLNAKDRELTDLLGSKYFKALRRLPEGAAFVAPHLSARSDFRESTTPQLSFVLGRKFSGENIAPGYLLIAFDASYIFNQLKRYNDAHAPQNIKFDLCYRGRDGVHVLGGTLLGSRIDSCLLADACESQTGASPGAELIAAKDRYMLVTKASLSPKTFRQNPDPAQLFLVASFSKGTIAARLPVTIVFLYFLGFSGMFVIVMSSIKQFKAKLRERELRARNEGLLEASGDLIHIMDGDGRIVYMNSRWLEVMRMEQESAVGAEWITMVAESSRTIATSMMSCAMTSTLGAPDSERITVLDKDGQELYLEGAITCRQNPDDSYELICVFRDETRNVTLMRDVQSQRDLLHHIIDVNPCYITIVDERGCMIEANRNACELAELDPFELSGIPMSRCFGEILDTDDRSLMLEEAAKTMKDVLKNEERITTRDGIAKWWNTRCCPISFRADDGVWFMFVSADITDFKRATEDLVAHDKMVAVGTLAGGVAHEFKNFLAAILRNSEYASDLVDGQEAPELIKESLREISSACDKANEVALSLLSYSKRDIGKRTCESLSCLAQEVMSIVEGQAAQRGVEIVSKMDESVKSVVSAGRIQQALINVLTNAIDAIDGDGIVTVIVRKNNDSAEIVVGDSGSGINEGELERIFTPFYSTKGVWGKGDVGGTGLGLSLVKSAVEEHGGTVMIKSMPGGGTSVALSLPLYEGNGDVQFAELPKWVERVLILSKEVEPVEHITACLAQSEHVSIEVCDSGMTRCGLEPTAHDVVILDGKYPGASTFQQALERSQSEGALPIIIRYRSLLVSESDITGVDVYDGMPDQSALLNDIASWSRRYYLF